MLPDLKRLPWCLPLLYLLPFKQSPVNGAPATGGGLSTEGGTNFALRLLEVKAEV